MAYAAVGELIGRAGTRCGAMSKTPAQIATYDPYADTDPNAVLLLDLLRALGTSLSERLKVHLEKEGSILTAGSATSYALPADFREMVENAAWVRASQEQLVGPVSAPYEQALLASGSGVVTNIPYRIRGLTIGFPVAPTDGLTITYPYISTYWVALTGSTTGTKATPTLASDVVLFDDELVVLGLVLRWKEERGLDTAAAAARFDARLEYAAGMNEAGPTLSLDGSGAGVHFLDETNLPITGY